MEESPMKISFDLHLPFLLPFKDKLEYISSYPKADFLLNFNRYKRNTVIDGKYLLEEKDCTTVGVTFMPDESLIKDVEADEIFKTTILNTTHFLNVLIDAIRINHKLVDIYNITIADFPILVYMYVDDDDEPTIYITRPQDMFLDQIELSKQELGKFGGMMQLKDTHPQIFLVEKFYASAVSRLYKEQMIEAVIDLQTSFEIFIRNTHQLLLLKKQATQSELENASSISFRNVVEDHIGRILNVDLNFITSSTPIRNWYQKLYILRNEIVHKGRNEISGEEAYEAHDAYINTRNYITKLLSTAGYIDASGNVDLTTFPKNTKGSISSEELLKKLKEKGIVEEDLSIYNPNNELK